VPSDTNYKEFRLTEPGCSGTADACSCYWAVAGARSPFNTIPIELGTSCTELCNGNPEFGPISTFSGIPNPNSAWRHREVRAQYGPTGYLELKTDNVHSTVSPVQCDTGYDLDGSARLESIGGFVVGGYARAYVAGGTTDSRMTRYFDDVYIDDTWSRVVLTDNQTYDQATITEPQIPSAWDNQSAPNSVTVTTNLGALTGDTAYLFVFDSDNNHNQQGYPIQLSGGAPPVCGNGSCDSGENCNNCPQDCGQCCGNTVCDAIYGENCGTCPGDCLQAGEVCCGNTSYAGNCCSDVDCTAPETCIEHNCQTQTQEYRCGAACSDCSNNILADSCDPSDSCDGTNTVEDIILPNSTTTAGSSLDVQVEYECYLGGSGNDQLALWYYNTSGWRLIQAWAEGASLTGCDTVNDSADGTVSVTFTVDDAAGTHYIRAIETGGDPITDECLSSFAWGDIDDLAFTVTAYHRADTSQDGCIIMNELLAFIDLWKLSSMDVPMPQLIEAIGLWKQGTGCS
jgi:hypothetical protein